VTDRPVLTWRENKAYRYIRTFIRDYGYAPTIREIADNAGLSSTSSVSYVLARLQDKGYLYRTAGRQAVALAGMVMVEQGDLFNLLTQVKDWIGVDGDEGYERLMAAAGLR